MSVLSRGGADRSPSADRAAASTAPGAQPVHDQAAVDAAVPVDAEAAVHGEAPLPVEVEAATAKRPLYPRLLRLRPSAPNAWQRALLGEGALAVAALLVLADLATAWTLVVLPLAVALIVKAHDLLAGALDAGRAAPPGA